MSGVKGKSGQSAAQIEAMEKRRWQAAALYLRGTRKGQIAEILGVKPNAVTAYIKWLEVQWVQELVKDPAQKRAIELAKVDEAERIARDHLTGYNILVNDVPVHITGDGRWWDRWLKALERRAKLLGLDAPIKVAPTNPAGDGPAEIAFTFEFDKGSDRDNDPNG